MIRLFRKYDVSCKKCAIFLKMLLVLVMILSSGVVCGSQREISAFSRSLLSADPLERTAVLKMMAKYGSFDESLFEMVNSLLLRELENNFEINEGDEVRQTYHPAGLSIRKIYVDEVSWMCEALAFSGQPLYRATLNRVREKSSFYTIRKYAKMSLKKLSEYEMLNACVLDNADDISNRDAKYICMIKSPDVAIKKSGAKHIYWSLILDDSVFVALENELISMLNQILDEKSDDAFNDGEVVVNKYRLDSMSWMCKALGSSGNPKYRESLSLIFTKSRRNLLTKLAGHAQWGMSLLDQIVNAEKIMKNVENDYSELPPESIRSICLVKSDNLFLQSFGAQHIYWSERTNEKVTDIIEEELLNLNELCFPKKRNPSSEIADWDDVVVEEEGHKITRDTINTLMWFSKVLGASGNDKYQSTLKKINSTGRKHTRLQHILDRYRK